MTEQLSNDAIGADGVRYLASYQKCVERIRATWPAFSAAAKQTICWFAVLFMTKRNNWVDLRRAQRGDVAGDECHCE